MIPIQTDQEGGAAEFLRDTAGHDANHTLMPAFVRKDDGFGGSALRQHGNGLIVNTGFHILPLTV